MPAQNVIKFRKGDASTWSSTNPILAIGEPGFDTTNNQIRIGDGINNWNDLPAIGAGIQGIQGIQGYEGLQGIQGIQGEQGLQGIQGESIQGAQGAQGSDASMVGPQGIEGSQGIQGIQGSTGASFNWLGEWNSSTNYVADDTVSRNGSTYVCISPISNVDPTTDAGSYWNLASLRGVAGLGYLFSTFTGNADPGTGYFGYNNSNLSSVTEIYIDNETWNGIDVGSYIDTWDDNNGANGAQGTECIQGIQGTTGYGDKGGTPYTFSTTTTNSDPGNSYIRYDNSTISSVAYIYIDDLDLFSNSQTNWYETWDDSSSSN